MNLIPGSPLSVPWGDMNGPSLSPDPESAQSGGFWDLQYPAMSLDSVGQ